MNIGYLICPNGLGHLRRSISVINEIILNKEVSITMYLDPNPYAKNLLNKINNKSKRIKMINVHLPHPNYVKTIVRYMDIIKKFKNLLINHDLIISDNLIYPLIGVDNKKIIFISQFFWHDIFVNKLNSENKDLINIEKSFFENNSFPILGNKLFSMDYIKSSKNYIPIDNIKSPIFRERVNFSYRNYVLLSDGTTGASSDFISSKLSLLKCFCNKYNLKIFVSPRIIFNNKSSDYEIFDYKPQSFKKVLFAICRPGLGIISDLIYFSSVPIPIYSENNKELKFNKKILYKLYNFKSDNFSELIEYTFKNIKKLSDISNKQTFNGEKDIYNFIF